MTTKGKARISRSSMFIRTLPELIENSEAAGMPVIITWRGPMPEHTQRLYAALGVLVRFVPGEETRDGNHHDRPAAR
jgi:hypothetical protein